VNHRQVDEITEVIQNTFTFGPTSLYTLHAYLLTYFPAVCW